MNQKASNKDPSYLDDLLLVFRRQILECTRKEGLKHDLTFSQTEILRFIGPNDKKTMKSIAEFLKISPPSATVMVSHMEEKGLVERVNHPSDRRVVFISLTPKTRKTFETISKRKVSIFSKMVSKLNQKDQKELERIIRILITE